MGLAQSALVSSLDFQEAIAASKRMAEEAVNDMITHPAFLQADHLPYMHIWFSYADGWIHLASTWYSSSRDMSYQITASLQSGLCTRALQHWRWDATIVGCHSFRACLLRFQSQQTGDDQRTHMAVPSEMHTRCLELTETVDNTVATCH